MIPEARFQVESQSITFNIAWIADIPTWKNNAQNEVAAVVCLVVVIVYLLIWEVSSFTGDYRRQCYSPKHSVFG